MNADAASQSSDASDLPTGVDSRVVAWRILQRVNRDGAWTGPAVDRALRSSDLEPRDRAFAANLAFQTLRWQGTLDWALGHAVRRPLRDIEPDLLDVLRLGAWQLLYGQVPDRAAVSTAVDVGRAVLPARTVGFINGVLRGLARQIDALPWPTPDSVAGQALRLGYPEWIVASARERFGAQAADELAAGNEPPPLTVRAAHGDRAELRSALEDAGATVTSGATAPDDALHVTGVTPGELMAFFGDRLVIQDEGSMVVSRAVAAAIGGRSVVDTGGPGHSDTGDGTVLDVCAAPGGKAVHLASLGLRVVAADRHPARLGLVAKLARRIGVPVATVVADATRPPWRAGSAAGVLVDAPCSGLGVVRRRPELRWKRDAADPATLAKLQGALLDGAAGLLAPGGALVYSVCTWTVAETTDVVEAFLSRTPAFALEPVAIDLTSAAPGPGLQLGSAAYGTDAMYIAVLRRARA